MARSWDFRMRPVVLLAVSAFLCTVTTTGIDFTFGSPRNWVQRLTVLVKRVGHLPEGAKP